MKNIQSVQVVQNVQTVEDINSGMVPACNFPEVQYIAGWAETFGLITQFRVDERMKIEIRNADKDNRGCASLIDVASD